MRHALLEVDQFAGIVELVADDPASAESHLRRAYNGFRRMRLDADTAETAALLGRACLALDRNAEADELCTESQHLAGHALKASITWRVVRAQLLARSGAHDDARRMAEEAVALAERTDALVDHGDACLALATVLEVAGDRQGARVAADKAVGLYELKGAAALAEKARRLIGAEPSAAPAGPEASIVQLDNACVRVCGQLSAALEREAWDEVQQLCAPAVAVESRRKIVGFTRMNLAAHEYSRELRRYFEMGMVRHHPAFIAVRGEHLALFRLEVGTEDVSPGAPQDEMLQLIGLDKEGRIAWLVWFDVDDVDAATAELDAAYARIGERHPRARLENRASRVEAQCYALFADDRPNDVGVYLAEGHLNEDRRKGLRRETTGRAAALENILAIAALGANITYRPLALRGDRLCLSHIRFEARDMQPDAFSVETLELTDVDTNGLMVARVVFDPDDIDAAIAELDARYLAGEAAPYAEIWQMVMDGADTLNRHEPGAMAERIVEFTDHRRIPFASDDIGHATDKLWALVPDARYRAAAVHALDAHGAVINLVIEGTGAQGNELQWSSLDVITFDSEQARLEVYEEDDVDAALARFEEIGRPARQLENAASRIYRRFQALFAARDWDAVVDVLAADTSTDDRRRVVNAGIRRGRDGEMANMRAVAELGIETWTSEAIATRGARLVLSRTRYFGGDKRPGEFTVDVLDIMEVDADGRVAALITFDLDDLDAAFEELDARYLAGEAAAHALVWSVITGGYAALNRHEIPPTTPDWVSTDHRRGGSAFAPGDLATYIRASWEDSPENRIHVEAVHRLNNLGAVVTSATHGASLTGFYAEWREIGVVTVDGDLINRTELFDEADLDVALARFDELNRSAQQLENQASRAAERFLACFAARDWDAMARVLADDTSMVDHRPLVGAGVRRGGEVLADWQATADIGVRTVSLTVIATRGERLALCRCHFSGRDQRPEAFHTDALAVAETNADEQVLAHIAFDIDDIDSAFDELDARYCAGEAGDHSPLWSLVKAAYAAFNRHELPPTTSDSASVDHRRGIAAPSGGIAGYVRVLWEIAPDAKAYIETAHRLNNHGTVITVPAHGTSLHGFAAEWREVHLLTFEGDLMNRIELFDETDLDAALARFDELNQPTQRGESGR